MVDSNAELLFHQEEVNIENRGDIMCRTPGKCRIESHSLFCALKRLFLLLSHLSGVWRYGIHNSVPIMWHVVFKVLI